MESAHGAVRETVVSRRSLMLLLTATIVTSDAGEAPAAEPFDRGIPFDDGTRLDDGAGWID